MKPNQKKAQHHVETTLFQGHVDLISFLTWPNLVSPPGSQEAAAVHWRAELQDHGQQRISTHSEPESSYNAVNINSGNNTVMYLIRTESST